MEQKCLIKRSELWYGVRAERSGLATKLPCVMLTYEVNREPEMRRDVSQLHRCDDSGREDSGTLKVWVAAPHEQDTVSSRRIVMITTLGATWIDQVKLGAESSEYAMHSSSN